jgi:hypothetical protein
MNNSFFKEIFVIQYEQGLYKLVIPCAFTIEPENVSKLSSKAAKESFAELLGYIAGWWIGKCEAFLITIKKVEVILPPLAEYLPIEESLYIEFEKDNIELEITTGLNIAVMEEEMRENMAYINERLAMFKQRNFGNN